MKTTVVVVAAGMGSRMGADKTKQLIEIKGKPILWYTLNVFEQIHQIDDVVLVVREKEKLHIKESIIDAFGLMKVRCLVAGGAERSESVYNGIKACVNADVIMIHDGARPFVDAASVSRLFDALETHDAAILGIPVKDTVKSVDNNREVTHTYDRKSLWAVQTPQAFKASLIRDAYKKGLTSHQLFYDDAMLVELSGDCPVVMVMGDETNIKITTPFDLALGHMILKQREGAADV